MKQDGTATFNQLGGVISAVGPAYNWPHRLDIFARRCAAAAADLTFSTLLGLLLFGAPLAARFLFDAWPATAGAEMASLSHFFDNCLIFAAALALLTQLFFYTALSESASAQASLGKILFGLRTSDSSGNRQTFAGALRRLALKYALLAGLIIFFDISVDFAAEFISTLQFEQFRLTVKILILVASFALCLVEEKEQNLYDIFTGRLVVADDTSGPGERWQNFCAAVRANGSSFSPVALARDLKVGARDLTTIVRTALTAWAYVGSLCLVLSVALAAMLG